MIDARSFFLSFWFLAGTLTVLRIIALIFSPANLGPDEAQYWFWSQTPAFGYFSKPPLIAWAIAVTTAVFGNAEWAVRLAAPLFHFGAAAFLYLAALRIFDRRVAFWTGLAWITLPGVILSSFLMTTDAPLLFFWSAALYCLVRIVKADQPEPLLFAVLGVAIGLGFLSKYAMIYFPAGLAAAMLVAPGLRTALLRPALLLTGVIAGALVLPNLLWNAQNDFQTLSHTAANANWGVELFNAQSLLTFLAGQFAVAGPVPFLALIVLVIAIIRGRAAGGEADPTLWRTLAILAVTPIVIVSVQSFISRAHANWAAAAYPSAVMLTTAFLFQLQKGWLARASVGLHAALALIFAVGVANLDRIDNAALARATKEIRGWEEQTAAIADAYMAQADNYDAVAIDDRSLMGAMLYYQRARGLEIVAIDPNAGVHHHYEAFLAFDPAQQQRVLFVSILDSDAHVNYRFRDITALGPRAVDIGGEPRAYHLFDISGYYGGDR